MRYITTLFLTFIIIIIIITGITIARYNFSSKNNKDNDILFNDKISRISAYYSNRYEQDLKDIPRGPERDVIFNKWKLDRTNAIKECYDEFNKPYPKWLSE